MKYEGLWQLRSVNIYMIGVCLSPWNGYTCCLIPGKYEDSVVKRYDNFHNGYNGFMLEICIERLATFQGAKND